MASSIAELIETISIPADSTLRDALSAINEGARGLALLADRDGIFVGLVTDGDIRRALLAGHGLESPVAEVDRPAPKVARAGTDPNVVAELFDEPVRVVPILDEMDRVVDLALFDTRMRIPVAAPMLGGRELQYVTECVLTGWISSKGRFVSRFEELFAEFCGVRHAIATSNGTTGLHLALLAAGIGPGDEVIVPTLTFVATANAVAYTGATPVPVDSESSTWNLDPERVAEAVTERTKAIVPVHLYGHPADMDPLLELARRHDLVVIEDAAEAHGARYKGRRVGGLGHIGVFSFYGNKILTTGEGGMVVADNDELADRVRLLRDHGMSRERRYLHPVLGYNYRLTNLQAAVGVAQMERADEILAAKRRVARLYADGLRDIVGITPAPEAPWAQSVFWLYAVLVDEREFGLDRDSLMAELDAHGIETRPFFVPVHQQPPHAHGERLPVAERLAASGLNLPSAAALSEDEALRVVEAIRDCASHHGSARVADPPAYGHTGA